LSKPPPCTSKRYRSVNRLAAPLLTTSNVVVGSGASAVDANVRTTFVCQEAAARLVISFAEAFVASLPSSVPGSVPDTCQRSSLRG
jgi:hypothetical protein